MAYEPHCPQGHDTPLTHELTSEAAEEERRPAFFLRSPEAHSSLATSAVPQRGRAQSPSCPTHITKSSVHPHLKSLETYLSPAALILASFKCHFRDGGSQGSQFLTRPSDEPLSGSPAARFVRRPLPTASPARAAPLPACEAVTMGAARAVPRSS